MIPVLIGVLISYAISNSLAMSFFDVLLDMKDLPYLPALGSIEHYHKKAKDIMNCEFLYLSQDSQLSDITMIMHLVGTKPKTIPVVESKHCRTLLFTV